MEVYACYEPRHFPGLEITFFFPDISRIFQDRGNPESVTGRLAI